MEQAAWQRMASTVALPELPRDEVTNLKEASDVVHLTVESFCHQKQRRQTSCHPFRG